MEKIIKRIIDIEYQAQAVIDNAAKEREERKKAQQEVLKEREGRIVQDANRKIDQIRQREMKDVAEIIAAENKRSDDAVQKLELQAKEQSKKWTDQIVASVLSR